MPVRELLARVGSDELTEWMAFYQLEPFGEMRADLRSGVVAATFANAHRTKDARAFTPEDFMPYIERTTPKDDMDLPPNDVHFFGLKKGYVQIITSGLSSVLACGQRGAP
jgi:hypothetical protein